MVTSRQEMQWVLRAQCNDREALEALLRSVQPSLRRYLSGLAGATDADDLLQDVLVIVVRKLGMLDDPKLFRPWSFRIASREAFRHIRKRRLWHGRHEDDAELDDLVTPETLPSGHLLRELLAIDTISPASRAVPHFLATLPLARDYSDTPIWRIMPCVIARHRQIAQVKATTTTEFADFSKNDDRISAAIRVNGDLRSTPTDLPADARFPIYSITKTLTAICVLRLAEIGSLRLGDAARQWLPEVDIPATITLTHLLRHTSGPRDYGPLPEYHQAVRTHPDQPWTRQQFLDAVLSKGLHFAPGERWAYSNVGYMLLIDVLERVTGQTFARVLNDFVSTPLALQRTSVLERTDDLMRCIPGFGSEVTADRNIVDVRGRYHPGWCAPRLVASTAEEITHVFDALIAGDVLGFLKEVVS